MKTVKTDNVMTKNFQKRKIIFNIGLLLLLLIMIFLIPKYGGRLSMSNSIYLIFICALLFPIIFLVKMIVFRRKE